MVFGLWWLGCDCEVLVVLLEATVLGFVVSFRMVLF